MFESSVFEPERAPFIVVEQSVPGRTPEKLSNIPLATRQPLSSALLTPVLPEFVGAIADGNTQIMALKQTTQGKALLATVPPVPAPFQPFVIPAEQWQLLIAKPDKFEQFLGFLRHSQYLSRVTGKDSYITRLLYVIGIVRHLTATGVVDPSKRTVANLGYSRTVLSPILSVR